MGKNDLVHILTNIEKNKFLKYDDFGAILFKFDIQYQQTKCLNINTIFTEFMVALDLRSQWQQLLTATTKVWSVACNSWPVDDELPIIDVSPKSCQ